MSAEIRFIGGQEEGSLSRMAVDFYQCDGDVRVR